MTIKETRDIFGDKFKDLTDEQVSDFINNMSIVCDDLLDQSIKKVLLAKELTKSKGYVK